MESQQARKSEGDKERKMLEESRLAEKMRDTCKSIDGFIYKLPRKKIMEDNENRLAKYEIGKRRSDGGVGKVLMLVGASGAGKSTLINGIGNYVYGVKWEDKFRFKLIVDNGESQAHSQTKWITAYVLHKQNGFALPYTLTVIDTPGFGDTEGITADEVLRNQIREFFSCGGNIGVDQLDGICFVVQGALARLTPTQKYIFDSILAVFGKDVEENIYVLTTFADSKRPPVLEALKHAAIPHQTYFTFNNSALYNEPVEDIDEFDKICWDMGMNSFKRFFKRFQISKPVSLTLTKKVLEERRRLQTALQGIQPQIIAGLGRLEQLRQEHEALKKHKAALKANKNFKIKVKVQKHEKVNLDPGEYVTNCLRCNFSCHYPCLISQDHVKDMCSAMGVDMETGAITHCLVCPNKCPPDQHFNNTYRFEMHEEEETRTAEDLKKKYQKAEGKILTAEGIMKALIKEFNRERVEILELSKRAHECLQKLDEIALKPDPLGITDYLNLLIETEKREGRSGHVQRIKFLEDTRAMAELSQKLRHDFDPFQEYMKEFEEDGFDISLFDPNHGSEDEDSSPSECDTVDEDRHDEEYGRVEPGRSGTRGSGMVRRKRRDQSGRDGFRLTLLIEEWLSFLALKFQVLKLHETPLEILILPGTQLF
ncbi:unnamed protein product [Darwinula stevensoni]|uniref:Septin-type G domain-containing protein n=1 Tax=Darwinula stevensoni TaxID=69355 RepID=A0A7R8X820_9CRUS|nr:unnamed protein product [Darwinula stevensoni]CAG0882939.1 unnamed protein product [Darwinula stevensoni]